MHIFSLIFSHFREIFFHEIFEFPLTFLLCFVLLYFSSFFRSESSSRTRFFGGSVIQTLYVCNTLAPLFTTCSPHVYHMFTTCTPHVHFFYTTCKPHVLVHYTYTTYIFFNSSLNCAVCLGLRGLALEVKYILIEYMVGGGGSPSPIQLPC